MLFALWAAPVSAATTPHWPNHSSTLGSRIGALGLHALPSEGAAEHIHSHLDVFWNGRRVTVPAYIGIDVPDQFITELHTHDATGIVHIESPTVRPFTLGQFFGEWDVPLAKARVWVDGRARSGKAATLVLQPHAEIVVAFGTAPKRIPRTYRFPAGY